MGGRAARSQNLLDNAYMEMEKDLKKTFVDLEYVSTTAYLWTLLVCNAKKHKADDDDDNDEDLARSLTG